MYTDIPDGTRLLGLTIKDGVATVDLSQEFGARRRPRVAPRPARAGRLHLTQFRTVDLVRFQLDGQPVRRSAPAARPSTTG